jgi:hypothetical protein
MKIKGLGRYIKGWTYSTVLFSILISSFLIATMTPEERNVAAPALLCTILVLWLWMTLYDRDGKIPFLDVGIFCALATFIYTVYPLVNYWVDGFQFGILSDNRLRQYNPDPAEMGLFHIRHLLYLFSFVVVYALFRRRGSVEIGRVTIPNHSARYIIVLFFLLLTGYFFLLQILTGVNYNASYESEEFSKNVAALADLPLLLLQVSGKLWGILFLFKLALLYIIVDRCRQKRWLIILCVWIAFEILQTFFIKGARTGTVLFLMATALFYHRMINHLSMKVLLSSGILLFLFFIFMGLYRAYIDFELLQTDLSQTDAGIFSGSNEFQALLGTAYDVLQRKEAGTYLPWYLYINDFSALLPPQQLMPFEKVSASEWYLREIGLSGTGFGFMWGVISQSIVGLDWMELLLRGGILGYILARIHRWYIKHQSEFLANLLYVYLCLRIYYTFRDTTFSILANFVWEVIPFYIILRLAVLIFSLSGRNSPNMGMAISNQRSK